MKGLFIMFDFNPIFFIGLISFGFVFGIFTVAIFIDADFTDKHKWAMPVAVICLVIATTTTVYGLNK